MADVLAWVAEKHGLTVKELKGPGRHRYVVHPRQEAMWIMVRVHGYSATAAGGFIGGRDHSTVAHACKAYEKRAALTV